MTNITPSKRDKKRHQHMKLSEVFCSRLKHLLAKRRVSARAFSLKAGLSHATISDMVNNARVPSLDNANQIASAFGLSLAEFLGDAGKEHDVNECARRVAREWKKQRTKG